MSLVSLAIAFQLAAPTVSPARPAYPFAVGERFDYSAKLGML